MAQGDVVQDLQTVASGAVLDARPTAGAEWVIHNLYFSQGVTICKTDGTNELIFETATSSGGRLGTVFHCTSTQWLRFKNMGASSMLVGYDGVQTKG